jgi:hypothetical protein
LVFSNTLPRTTTTATRTTTTRTADTKGKGEKSNAFYDGKWSFHMFQKRRIIKEKTRKVKSQI